MLNTKKGNTFKYIPAKVLKENSHICCVPLSDVTPVFKSDDVTKNKHSVSLITDILLLFRRDKQYMTSRRQSDIVLAGLNKSNN